MNKINFVRQDDLKDCGICSLLMIIRYYYGDIPKEYLREMTKTNKDGVSAFYLVKAAQELGFSTYAVSGELKDLKCSDFPLIAHVIINKSYQHFVVLYGIKNNKIIMADPSCGIKKISLSEWNNITTKKYLLFKPLKKIPKIRSNKEIIKIIYQFIFEHIKIFIMVFLLSIFYVILNIMTSYNFKLFMSSASIINQDNLRIIFISLIFLGVIKSLIDLFRNKLICNINNKLDKILINKIYHHIICLPYLYYKTRTCGDIITRINDITNVKDFIGRIFMVLFVDLILSVFSLIMLFRISSNLTIYALVIALLYGVVIIIYNKILYPLIQKNYEDASGVNSYLVESINAIDTVKGLNMENYFINSLNYKYSVFANTNKKIGYLLYKENFFKELINYIGITSIIFEGIRLIILNELNTTDLITFMTILTYFLEPLRNVLDLTYNYKTSILSLKRVIELYNIESEKYQISKKSITYNLKGNIVIKNLSFSFNGIKNVLHNIDFLIKAQDKVLIYGPSGCGKSTLVKLLNKFYDNYQGEIYLDNRNLQDYELLDIRKRICYISQNEMLFTDTLYHNIDLNDTVQYDDFIRINELTFVREISEKLPLGYDTLIEENGFNFSSGERQRIILSRALLKKADIYIFDEALSNIDIQYERLILQNIFALFKDKTIIVISHRFNNEDLFNRKLNIGVLNEC